MLRVAAVTSILLVMVGALVIPTVPGARAATFYVEIADFSFTPSTVTVNIGDTVVWNNTSPSTHTVTSTTPAGELNSGNIAAGGQYTHTFLIAGTYNYHCSIHISMTGSVVVIDPSIPEFSSVPLVVFGMLVLAVFVLVAGKKR